MAWQDHYTPSEFRAAIKKLVYEDGLSASRAAKALRGSPSKNMVIRQMQWLKANSPYLVKFPDSVWPSVTKIADDKKPENERRAPVHLLDVAYGQCRAPLWPDFLHSKEKVDPSDHMYCGKACKEESSFCAEHHAIFFPPELQKRKRKKPVEDVKDNTAYFA